MRHVEHRRGRPASRRSHGKRHHSPTLGSFRLLCCWLSASWQESWQEWQWAACPGFSRPDSVPNEVIVAIMLNYICTLFTSYLVNGPLRQRFHGPDRADCRGNLVWQAAAQDPADRRRCSCCSFIAAAMYIFLWKTSVGYQLRAVGANPSAAGTAGIRVNLFLIMSMTLSGGIAALAGSYRSIWKIPPGL